jgi:hypothetical protein
LPHPEICLDSYWSGIGHFFRHRTLAWLLPIDWSTDFAKYVLTAEKNKQNSATTLSEALAASQLSLLLFILTKFLSNVESLPIQTKVLVSDLMTGLYLHLRLFHIGLLILHNARRLGIRLVTFPRNLRKKINNCNVIK